MEPSHSCKDEPGRSCASTAEDAARTRDEESGKRDEITSITLLRTQLRGPGRALSAKYFGELTEESDRAVLTMDSEGDLLKS
mmetsp:Transcript_92415/g.258266  ORF Transcript_92415/g.258266 Transcript_92415/m.258266 type:complete len:82 (+) Transcript_92415:141-386(+)